MNYLDLLEACDQTQYFLSLLSCGTTFSKEGYQGKTVAREYNQTIRKFLSQFKKEALIFEDFSKAIDEGLSKSQGMNFMYPEVLGHTGLTLDYIDPEKAKIFSHYLLKKYKQIDYIEDPLFTPVTPAITSCIIDDYVMSFQKSIKRYDTLDDYLSKILQEIYKNKETIEISDLGCFQKERNERRYHEYIITSTTEKPVDPVMFGKIVEKAVESLHNKEDLSNSIKEIMLFYRLEYSIDSGKTVASRFKI